MTEGIRKKLYVADLMAVLSVLLTTFMIFALLNLGKTIKDEKKNFRESINLRMAGCDIPGDLDDIQENLKCCGFKSYCDWKMTSDFDGPLGNKSSVTWNIPPSCCKKRNGNEENASKNCGLNFMDPSLNENVISAAMYTDGCRGKMDDILKTIIIVFLVLILLIYTMAAAYVALYFYVHLTMESEEYRNMNATPLTIGIRIIRPNISHI